MFWGKIHDVVWMRLASFVCVMMIKSIPRAYGMNANKVDMLHQASIAAPDAQC